MPPQGLVVALQYWPGDELRTFRLARLLADIETKRRDDVTIAFVRRFDMETESALLWQTRMHVGHKFGTMALRSRRDGVGHPHGPNELWSSTMDQLSTAWRTGNLWANSVFTAEADGVPLRADWLDLLVAAHKRTLEEGRRVTGPLMQRYPHLNGSLIAHLSLWHDRPSLHRTPSEQGWDMFHAQVLMSEGRPEQLIKNVYGACNWSPESLFALSHETAWLASQKDDTALEWAEQNIVATSPIRAARSAGCWCPNPRRCVGDECRCGCGDCLGGIAKIERIRALETELKALKGTPGLVAVPARKVAVPLTTPADDGAGDEVIHATNGKSRAHV